MEAQDATCSCCRGAENGKCLGRLSELLRFQADEDCMCMLCGEILILLSPCCVGRLFRV